jgi:2'-5' RNA ligase
VQPPSGLAIPIRLPTALARVRDRWDRAARAGARPHVTVLFPFLPLAGLTPAVRAALADIAGMEEAFDLRFVRIRRFDDGLVWAEPEPVDPIVRLTQAVAGTWPAYPPYGGLFETVIPHLTIVESMEAPLEEIESGARGAVPFEARATRLELWRQDDGGRWRPHWRLPLGRPGPRP